MVFPGGAVDSEDRVNAIELTGSQDLGAVLRCAAVREVFEESGVGIFEPALAFTPEDCASWRGRVRSDAGQLRALCGSCGVRPAVHSLHFWCSFITPDMEHMRLKKGGFDARFLVWCANERSALKGAVADLEETVN